MEVQAPAVAPATVGEKPVVEAVAPTTEPKSAEAPASEQYELPDGTKTDAAGLSKAWRDNFMPEFTRRSQELAALKSKTESAPAPTAEAPKTPWADPGWEPKTYQELAESIAAKSKAEVWQQILDESTRADREAKERDAYIAQEQEQLKALDPKVNIAAVMAHAAKLGTHSLIPAYQSMKTIELAEQRAEERVLKNIKLRAGEPVGAGTADPGAGIVFPPGVRTGYDKAKWILNNQK